MSNDKMQLSARYAEYFMKGRETMSREEINERIIDLLYKLGIVPERKS